MKPPAIKGYPPKREHNKQLQTALNSFGFDVGQADGVIGRGTRSGIVDYQAYMGYPATGQLTEVEQNLLLSGMNRLNSGQIDQYMPAIQRDGTKGMLKALRGDKGYAQRFGSDSDTGTGVYAGHDEQPLPLEPIVTPEFKKPVILKPVTQVATISMADRCDFVGLLGATNGVIKAGSITDPDRALSEQFCGMRAAAIGDGVPIMNRYEIDSASAVEQVCGPVKEAMKVHFSVLSEGNPEVMSATAAQTIAGLGVNDPALIRDYGKICLTAGYDLDDAEIALSGALLMLSIKEYGYAETAAHHLREGFGVKPDVPAAVSYYPAALTTFDQDAQPSFLPEQAKTRVEVIRGSVSQISGNQFANVDPVNGYRVKRLLQKN